MKNIDTHDSLIGFNVTIKDEQAPAEPEAPEAPVPLEINSDGVNGFILEDGSITDDLEKGLSELNEAESSTTDNPKYEIGTAVFTFRQLTETELSDMYGAIYMNGTARWKSIINHRNSSPQQYVYHVKYSMYVWSHTRIPIYI